MGQKIQNCAFSVPKSTQMQEVALVTNISYDKKGPFHHKPPEFKLCAFLLKPFYERGNSLHEEIRSVCLVSVRHHFFPLLILNDLMVRPSKPYIFWKHITLATKSALFWLSTTKYWPLSLLPHLGKWALWGTFFARPLAFFNSGPNYPSKVLPPAPQPKPSGASGLFLHGGGPRSDNCASLKALIPNKSNSGDEGFATVWVNFRQMQTLILPLVNMNIETTYFRFFLYNFSENGFTKYITGVLNFQPTLDWSMFPLCET